ncbi:MAG: hypothetical protein WBV39_16040 [Rudaea sp.]
MSEYLVVRTFSLSGPELNEASEAERAFLLAGGHLQNEVATLNKLFVWSIPRATGPFHDDIVQSGQALMLGKILAGKLSEGWTLIERIYFGTKLSRLVNLPPLVADALKQLKAYFGKKGCLVRLVRNDFAFHYSPSGIGAQ